MTFGLAIAICKSWDLSNNSLSGPVPDFLTQLHSLKVFIDQNPNLCESTSCNQQTDNQEKEKKNIVIPVVASVAGIESKQIRQYTFDDLTKIKNNFDRVLGKGGFGTVYHGLIDDTQVAVKMLSPSTVKLLMRVHHKNLTSLIGYCNEENNKGLIYEYMASGNLADHISGKSSRAKFFNWEDRLRIAVDAAQGLEHLHNGCKPPIIHRDVKTTNILLNENFQAKLADFGLSKTFPTDGGTHLSTVVAGTPGYLDPESMVSNGDIKNIVDSRLHEDFETSSVWKAVEIGIASVSINPTRRPNMSGVVNELKECLATELARKRAGRDTENNDSIELVSLLTTEVGPLAR
ncbi:Serine/threonine-protein kinase, active site [Sesbania bispinosa]|nr:Serine/threonine-protein kinase, active site [Sesbania bispinosa]